MLDELHLENHTVDLANDDMLVLYTDGVTDAINRREEEFGTDRPKNVVMTALGSKKDLDAQDVVDIVVNAVNEHKGDQPQFDDVTLFVIKRLRGRHAG